MISELFITIFIADCIELLRKTQFARNHLIPVTQIVNMNWGTSQLKLKLKRFCEKWLSLQEFKLVIRFRNDSLTCGVCVAPCVCLWASTDFLNNQTCQDCRSCDGQVYFGRDVCFLQKSLSSVAADLERLDWKMLRGSRKDTLTRMYDDISKCHCRMMHVGMFSFWICTKLLSIY